MTNPNLVNTSQVYMRSNVQLPINTSATDILETPSASNMIIRADTVTICNTTAIAISVDVYLTRAATTYAIAKTITVPAYSSLVTLDKDYPLYLEEGDKLQVQASAWGLQAICAYTIISDTSITLPSRPAINELTPSISYLDFASADGTAVTTRTFTGMSFGTEESGRYIAVAVHAFYNTDGRNITSVTVGGVAATEVIATTENVSQTFAYAGIWVADATGTSGDVVITSDNGIDSWGAGTFKLIANSPTPTATAQVTDNAIGSASFPLSWGAVSLCVSQGVNDINPTWTNATKQYGNDIRSNEWASTAIPTIINSSGTVSVDVVDGAVVATWN